MSSAIWVKLNGTSMFLSEGDSELQTPGRVLHFLKAEFNYVHHHNELKQTEEEENKMSSKQNRKWFKVFLFVFLPDC